MADYVSPTMPVFILGFFHASDKTLGLWYWANSEMILSPELHFFFFFAMQPLQKKSNNIPHTLSPNLLLQQCDLSGALLLLVNGFVMVVRLSSPNTQRQRKEPGGPSMEKAKWKPFLPGDSAGFCSRRLSGLYVCTRACFCLFVCTNCQVESTFRRLPALFSHCRPLLFPLL